jgi:hypothetical protein
MTASVCNPNLHYFPVGKYAENVCLCGRAQLIIKLSSEPWPVAIAVKA